MNWRLLAENKLIGENVPRFLSMAMLYRIANYSKKNISDMAFNKWVEDLVDAGRLIKVMEGLYVNMTAVPSVTQEEGAHYIKAGAVVSLHSVLGHSGFLNNPPAMVTAVVPVAFSNKPMKVETPSPFGEYVFYEFPLKFFLLEGVTEKDVLDQGSAYNYKRATVEKALCDWLYLANLPHSKIGELPLDTDIEMLNKKRLTRIAYAMGIEDIAEAYIKKALKYQQTEEYKTMASPLLGW